MVEFLGRIFAGIFGSHSGIATVIISMFPLIELKGGIPVGMSKDFWGEYALGATESFFLALLGSCIVVPILAIIFKPIIEWLKRTKLFKKIGHMLDQKIKSHSESINSKTKDAKSIAKKTWLKALFIFGFVAVPLPLTGVWTGTCVAVAIGLKFWQTVLSVVLGNMVAGLIIATVCAVFPEFTTILFIIFLVFILFMIAYTIIKNAIKKKKENDSKNSLHNISTEENSSKEIQVESSNESKENLIINGNNVEKTSQKECQNNKDSK